MIVQLALLAALSPIEAAHVAALEVGRPDIVADLVRVCMRESRCERIGIHSIDARPGASSYAGQIRLGHLDARCQPKGDWRRWGTRGSFGMNAADAWPYMPLCYAPESLDIPIVAARAAVGFYLARCDGERRSRWCPRRRHDGRDRLATNRKHRGPDSRERTDSTARAS